MGLRYLVSQTVPDQSGYCGADNGTVAPEIRKSRLCNSQRARFQVTKGSLLDRLHDAATTTWLHQVAGIDADGYIREDASASF